MMVKIFRMKVMMLVALDEKSGVKSIFLFKNSELNNILDLR